MMDDYAALLSNPDLTPTLGRASAGEIEILSAEQLPEQDRSALPPHGILYRDRFIQLVKDVVRFPSGRQGTYIRILAERSVAGVCIVPVYRQRLAMIRQFRHPTRSWHVQLPRGFAEGSGPLEDSASRELFEETGVRARALTHLGRVFADTGLLGSSVAIYAALLDEAPRALGDTGVAELVMASRDEFHQMLTAGAIDDAITIAAATMYFNAGVACFGTPAGTARPEGEAT